LVTKTSRDPVAALPEIVTLAVSEVELTKLSEFTVMPDPENPSVAPETKLVPVIVIVWLVVPWSYEPGATEVTVGGCTVTELLAPLVVDHERQTATTWYV
jgi:hypothetical protein